MKSGLLIDLLKRVMLPKLKTDVAAAAIFKIDKMSLISRVWPNFDAIWQADAE